MGIAGVDRDSKFARTQRRAKQELYKRCLYRLMRYLPKLTVMGICMFTYADRPEMTLPLLFCTTMMTVGRMLTTTGGLSLLGGEPLQRM